MAGEDAGLRTYLRKQLAAADRQACLEEGRRLRREKPILSDAEIIQTVKAMHRPRRQKLRIESDLVAELARMAPLEPRRRAEVAQPAARPAGSSRLDWRSFGPIVGVVAGQAELAARYSADLARAWRPTREELAVLRSHQAVANWLAEHRMEIERAAELYHENRRLFSDVLGACTP